MQQPGFVPVEACATRSPECPGSTAPAPPPASPPTHSWARWQSSGQTGPRRCACTARRTAMYRRWYCRLHVPRQPVPRSPPAALPLGNRALQHVMCCLLRSAGVGCRPVRHASQPPAVPAPRPRRAPAPCVQLLTAAGATQPQRFAEIRAVAEHVHVKVSGAGPACLHEQAALAATEHGKHTRAEGGEMGVTMRPLDSTRNLWECIDCMPRLALHTLAVGHLQNARRAGHSMRAAGPCAAATQHYARCLQPA